MLRSAFTSDRVACVVRRLSRAIVEGRYVLPRRDGIPFGRTPIAHRPDDLSELPPANDPGDACADADPDIARARLDERARLARDLHDQTGQQISTLKLQLYKLRNETESLSTVRDILQIETLVDELARDLHRVVANLQPAGLEELGLVPVLRNMAEEWSAETGVVLHLDIAGLDPEPDRDLNTALYHIAQECLTNIRKHAGTASTVGMKLQYLAKEVVLTIDDDGLGIDEPDPAPEKRHHFGLSGMRTRAAMLGGRVEVGSGPRGGTQVRARVPLRRGST